MDKRFSIKSRLLSFKYAFEGFKALIKDEANARIHIIISLAVIILGFIFKINANEWTSICLAIALVISMEAINTAIENLSDFVSPKKDKKIKKIKDISAFAVLFSAIIAVVIGMIIFIPKISTALGL